jgi:hypothetical protein
MASNDLATTITDFTTDIGALKQNITDSLTVGNSMYGPYGHADVTSEVGNRTAELSARKTELKDKIKEQEAIIRRSDRDFTDVRNTLPETIPTKSYHVLEDYSLLILSLSYLFMLIIGLHTYVVLSTDTWSSALIRGLFYSLMLTLISCALLYYFC